MTTHDHEDVAALKSALIGRRIVAAERSKERRVSDAGLLTLDDGSKLRVIPSVGCGGCNSGWYEIESLTTFDNVITRVETTDDLVDWGDSVSYDDRENTLTINVYAEGISATVARVVGSVGNGYYGRGYEFEVIPA